MSEYQRPRYGPLFDPPHQKHSDTSREAAEEIRPSASSLRERVFKYIDGAGLDGATDQQIQKALGMDPSTERPRRIELVRERRVFDSGRSRQPDSGRNAVVWITATEGRK